MTGCINWRQVVPVNADLSEVMCMLLSTAVSELYMFDHVCFRLLELGLVSVVAKLLHVCLSQSGCTPVLLH